MGKCRDIEPQLTAYVDGEVDGVERETLETHLERCPPCRSRVATE
jgi:anti-sigma factor RsiW